MATWFKAYLRMCTALIPGIVISGQCMRSVKTQVVRNLASCCFVEVISILKVNNGLGIVHVDSTSHLSWLDVRSPLCEQVNVSPAVCCQALV